METKQIIIYLLSSAFTFFLGYFFKPYNQEKMKNKALKEDIGKLTEITEEIKNKFQVENEFLKSNLSFTSQYLLDLKIEEKNTLLEYNRVIAETLHSFNNYSTNFFETINNNKDSNEKLNLEFSKFIKISSAVFIFIRDDINLVKEFQKFSFVLHNYKKLIVNFFNDNFISKGIYDLSSENSDYFFDKMKELENITNPLYFEIINNQDIIRGLILERLSKIEKIKI